MGLSEKFVLDEDTSGVEPWVCQGCGKLIHNTVWDDDHPVPVEGAPPATFGNSAYQRVCQMCSGMIDVIQNSAYFLNIHNETSAYRTRMRQKFKEG